MEKESTNFFVTNIAYIKTIISILLGSGISYFTTIKIEKRKEKKEFKLKAAYEVLIPLGEIIEDLIKDINKKRYNDIKFEDYFKELNKLSIYLNIKNRFFLNKNLILQLEKYIDTITLLNNNLNREYKNSLSEYKCFLSEILQNFESSENIFINFNPSIEYILKKHILNKTSYIMNHLIESIVFREFEEHLEKIKQKTIIINEEIITDYGAVNWGLETKDNLFNENPDAFDLIEFIEKYINPYETNKIKKIINKTSSSKELEKVEEYLKSMRTEIIKNIDKIKN